MLQANERWAPAQSPDTTLAQADRGAFIMEADSVGSIPPPTTIQSLLKTGLDKIMGSRPDILMDKIGERIAFERAGTRLYDALILKYETLSDAGRVPALPVPPGVSGDSVASTLQRIRSEEHGHFLMLCEVMRTLGGDPTAQTPCADVAATASMGLMQVVTDPRTTLAQSLNAVLTAELTDNAGWELLTTLAEGAGQTELVQQFQRARAQEDEHLLTIKSLLTAVAWTPAPPIAP